MSRIHLTWIVACLMLATTGCANRANPYGNWWACNPTVAPPATYGINIPSVARNQPPYYTPGNTYQVNPQGRAPTPATQSGANGWRPSDNARTGASNTQERNDSVLTTPTTFVESSPTRPATGPMNSVLANSNPVTRTASAAPLPGTGVSSTNASDYRTTRIDERNDATRLPVTDASQVRAPSRNFPTGTVANGPYGGNYTGPIGYQQTYAGQPVPGQGGYYPQPTAYTGAPVLMPRQQPVQQVVYNGQPVLVPRSYTGTFQSFPTSSQPTVLAQSTTAATGGSSSQLGWQSRELSSDRTRR